VSQTAIWPGSGSAVSSSTPYGFYDTDSEFQTEAPQFAKWAAYQFGYPIVDVELQDVNFYAAFEQSVTEYSNQVNQFQIRDNLLHLQGQSTSSMITQRQVTPTLGRVVFLAKQYGTEVGAGGLVDWNHTSITVNTGSQVYNLNTLIADISHSEAIEIKRVFHEQTPAIARYFDPYAGTGAGSYNMMDSFGWGNMTPAVQFMMMPIYADLLRIQAIELNDQIRKSAYSFELINNQFRIFPMPTSKFKVFFDYIVTSQRDNSLITDYSGSTANVISDYSNIPYENMTYSYINGVGKQWIRKYALASSKEILGRVRGKFASIPIPNAETSLDGDTLVSEAQTEKEALLTELRETLEATQRKALMEADKEEASHLEEKLKKVPLGIFIA